MSNKAHCSRSLQLTGNSDTNFADLLATVMLGSSKLNIVDSLTVFMLLVQNNFIKNTVSDEIDVLIDFYWPVQRTLIYSILSLLVIKYKIKYYGQAALRPSPAAHGGHCLHCPLSYTSK